MRLTQPGYGRGMLVYGVVSMVIGFLVVNHLSRFRV
jgi:Flp pilus assembly protein TadB